MTTVDPSAGLYGSILETGDGASSDGMVFFGGVRVSSIEAAQFVMMHRTGVMKEVGADRTEMAQRHLDKIRAARQMLIDLQDLYIFSASSKVYRDRCPITPEMEDFLKNDVNCSPEIFTNRLIFYASRVPLLPESVRNHYGLYLGEDGKLITYSDRAKEFDFEAKGGNREYQISGVRMIDRDSIDGLKSNVNNYIDQVNDSNNLFMTKFKQIVNLMNTALESANSLADKTNDMTKNLVSRW